MVQVQHSHYAQSKSYHIIYYILKVWVIQVMIPPSENSFHFLFLLVMSCECVTRHFIRLIASLKFLKVNIIAHHYYIFIFLKLFLYKTDFFYVSIAPPLLPLLGRPDPFLLAVVDSSLSSRPTTSLLYIYIFKIIFVQD